MIASVHNHFRTVDHDSRRRNVLYHHPICWIILASLLDILSVELLINLWSHFHLWLLFEEMDLFEYPSWWYVTLPSSSETAVVRDDDVLVAAWHALPAVVATCFYLSVMLTCK